MTLTSDLTQILHRVELTHGLTGAPMQGVTARLLPPAPWWLRVRVIDGWAVVHAVDSYPAVSMPLVLRLEVADPVSALMVASPTVDLPLTTPTLTQVFVLIPQTVTAEVVDSHGVPVVGAAVEVSLSSGSAIALPELAAQPGHYQSQGRTWSAADNPFDLKVDTLVAGRFRLDPRRTDTRLQVVTTA